MNKILFSEREEIRPNTFLFPFRCSDAKSIRTELRPAERSDIENERLKLLHERITSVLQSRGYEVVSISFWSMLISARKV